MEITEYKLLIKILTEWSINNKQYDVLYFIYTNFNIGIPVKFLYKLENKNLYFCLTSFVNGHETKYIKDENLKKIVNLFKKSKYKRLKEWNNIYGYSLL